VADSNNTVDILFRTRLERQGAQQFADELERTIGKLKAQGKDVGDLQAQLDRLRASLNSSKVEGSGGILGRLKETLYDAFPAIEKVGGALGKLGGGTVAVATAGIAGLVAVIDKAKDALLEFANAEQQVAKLDAALAQSQQLTDEYREHLQALAEQFEELTGVAGEKWLAVLTRLTQFGAEPGNIEQYAEAVKNLAGLMDGDVSAAANVFSRALQGNFELFGRYGIVVDEAGTQTEKLSKLMEQLAQRGGGQLEASNRTLIGSFTTASNAVSNLMKEFGRLISATGIVQGVAGALASILGAINHVIGGVIPKVEGLHNAVQKSADAFDAASKGAKSFAESQKQIRLETEGVTSAIARQIEAIRAKQVAEDETADAQMALEMAKINRQEKEHKITPEQAIRARAGTRIAFETAKQLRADAADKAELEAKTDEKKALMGTLVERYDAVSQQEGQVEKIEDFQKRKAEFAKEMIERRKYLESAQKSLFEKISPVNLDGKTIHPWTNPQEYDAQKALFAEAFKTLDTQESSGRAAFEREFKNKFQIYGNTGSLAEEKAKLQKMKEALQTDAPELYKNADKAQGEADKINQRIETRRKVRGINQRTITEETQGETFKAREEKQKEDEQEQRKRIEEQIKLHGKSAAVESLGDSLQNAFKELNEGWVESFAGLQAEIRAANQEISILRDRGSVRS
jgi:AAA15 family ATPase/GTPase/uncharacterized coiled-coil protein SlyX